MRRAALWTWLIFTPAYAGEPNDTASRSTDDIRQNLAAILRPTNQPGDAMTAEREAALRRLRAYRYLAGLPYAEVTLDDDLNKYAQAAAALCDKLKRLDHKPDNPGMPEDEYQFALKGAGHSNLYFGPGKIADSIDAYMDDSNAANIEALGHRRWCLNPPMGKVGFGKSGIYMAMWCFDRSNAKAPFVDFVAYPARGYMPIEFFKPTAAWSISLNPSRFRKSDKEVQARIFTWEKTCGKKGEPLELNHHSVDTRSFAMPFCVSFRPPADAVSAGKAYRVEITGLTRVDGTAATIEYTVEFFRLGAKP